MHLSDEQMAAFGGAGIAGWEEVARPTGRQALPEWLINAAVAWGDGHPGAPEVKLRVHGGDIRYWPGQRWTHEGKGCYIARHDDGRAAVLYHSGEITRAAAWRIYAGGRPFVQQWQIPTPGPGETWRAAAEREGGAHLAQCQGRSTDDSAAMSVLGYTYRAADLRLVVIDADVTTAQRGFGGDRYALTMDDGSTRILRGPWHGGAPSGLVEVSFQDAGSPYAQPDRWTQGRPWHEWGGMTAGLYVTEDLFLRALAAYCPHVPIARVRHAYGVRLEPFRAEWGEPKGIVYERERLRAAAEQPAGPHWRVYWGRGHGGAPLTSPPNGLRDDAGESTTTPNA